MAEHRERIEAAETNIRSVLHEPLGGCSVQEIDGMLVELCELTWRVAELAGRLDRVLGCRAESDPLRLDAHCRERFCSPEQAIEAAQSDLALAVAAGAETARLFHDARQITSAIGLVFDDLGDDGDEVEF